MHKQVLIGAGVQVSLLTIDTGMQVPGGPERSGNRFQRFFTTWSRHHPRKTRCRSVVCAWRSTSGFRCQVTVLLLHGLIAGKMKPAVRTRVDVLN